MRARASYVTRMPVRFRKARRSGFSETGNAPPPSRIQKDRVIPTSLMSDPLGESLNRTAASHFARASIFISVQPNSEEDMKRTPQGLFLLLAFLLFGSGTMLTQAQTTQSIQFPNPFKHVIVIFQENRTPDNLFQGLCTPPFGTAGSCSTTPSATQYNIATKNWLDK